jgi:uncharacterized membrane protein YphA (DoxX/SURF4 family)
MLLSATRYAAVLAALRIYLGLAWLSHGFGKVTNPHWAAPGGGFESILKDISSGTSGAYYDFVTGFVLPHSALFAVLVAWGETLTGVALILGLWTRFAGGVGAFLALNYWMASGEYAQVTSIGGLNFVFAVLSAVNVLAPTGLVAGLDGIIAARKRPAAMVGKSS